MYKKLILITIIIIIGILSMFLLFNVKSNTYNVSKNNSFANKPSLIDGMIPVIYDGNNWVVADNNNIDYNWYNYDNGKWANAIIVNDYSKYVNFGVGSIVNNEDIVAFYVWIPRYKYRVFNINKENGYDYYNALENGIDIVFEEGTNTTGNIKCNYYYKKKLFNNNYEVCSGNNGGYYTHPAFTFGDIELEGIWVGKFETTGSADNPTILPSDGALMNLSIYNQFNTSKLLGTFLNGSNDAHMMKNIEWGAVAYLTHSKYGRCISGCQEVGFNNCTSFSDTGSFLTGTSCLEDGSIHYYDSNLGVLNSNTGNITGIYDMNGGASENVMGNISKSKNKYVFNEDFHDDFSISWYASNEKYLDTYGYNEDVLTDKSVSNSRLGDAMGETRGWYEDSNWAANVDIPWIERGGNFDMIENAGIFAYGGNMGYNIRMNGFRSVIVSG